VTEAFARANDVAPPMNTADFTAFLRRNAGLIHKIAYAYCRDATDREDVLQEIAVQLLRSAGRFDHRVSETTWIYRIALNVAISFHRRERRRRDPRDAADVHALSITADAPRSDEVETLLECIDGLEPLDKALVMLHLDDADHTTIADVLGISTTNVGTKLHRIKDKLRAAFALRSEPNSQRQPHGTR
jgi:RNA polymerase sigma factor (sigma-70 family)